jgi:hypothetical protein
VIAALWLMLLQGALGAFDTVYYHEYRARLVAGGERTRPELWLHAARDLVYAALFATLPRLAWCGTWALVLGALIAVEIVITMADFVVEVKVREPVGVLPGERVTHGLMAIIYGAALACLAPHVLDWSERPTALVALDIVVPAGLKHALTVMAVGVFLSGLRDVHSALGLPGAGFPWRAAKSGRRASTAR